MLQFERRRRLQELSSYPGEFGMIYFTQSKTTSNPLSLGTSHFRLSSPTNASGENEID
jgi:hypothetical protein